MLLEVKDVTTYTRYMVYYLVRMLMNGAENYTNIILSTIMKFERFLFMTLATV